MAGACSEPQLVLGEQRCTVLPQDLRSGTHVRQIQSFALRLELPEPYPQSRGKAWGQTRAIPKPIPDTPLPAKPVPEADDSDDHHNDDE